MPINCALQITLKELGVFHWFWSGCCDWVILGSVNVSVSGSGSGGALRALGPSGGAS